MKLKNIRSQVSEAQGGNWNVLSGDAPTYLNRFVDVREGDERWLEQDEHEGRAVLCSDVDIGLAWGMSDRTPNEEPVVPDWTEPLVARRASPHVVEVLFRGQPVDRQVYAVIDNACGLVPWPRAWYPDDDYGATPLLRVSRWQLSLVSVLHSLGVTAGGDSVESYVQRFGFEITD